jgi:hypothetical protein
MGGLVIDIIIEFFFRMSVNLLQRIGTSKWPVVTAIVSESERREPGMGCTVVVIRYRYRNMDTRCEGVHKEPFFFDNYANAYLRRFPAGSEFAVRVNPKDPSYSIPAEGEIDFITVK